MKEGKNRKNGKHAAIKRRERVATLYCQGESQRAIAEQLGIALGTVCNDLTKVREQWQESQLSSFDAKMSLELARIDHLESVAWRQFLASCDPAETIRERTEQEVTDAKKGGLKTKKKTTDKTTKRQCGDPRFLERVSWCVEQRLKLLGGYDVKAESQTTINVNWSEMLVAGSERRNAPNPVTQKINDLETQTERESNDDRG